MGERNREGRRETGAGEERKRKLLFCALITNVVESAAGSVGEHLLCMRKQAVCPRSYPQAPAGTRGKEPGRRGLARVWSLFGPEATR